MARLRLKTHWFKADRPHSAEEIAGALAFVSWRVAHNALMQMRGARFDIEVGTQYFDFMREWLVFIVAVLDRMAHERMPGEARVAFTTSLAQRAGAHLAENEDRLLGAVAPGEAGRADRFIDLVNELAPHYAEFGHDASGPDFAFMRYLGHRIEALMPQKDRHWVVDQVVAIEAPEAVRMLAASLQGLMSNEPRAPRRGVLSGD